MNIKVIKDSVQEPSTKEGIAKVITALFLVFGVDVGPTEAQLFPSLVEGALTLYLAITGIINIFTDEPKHTEKALERSLEKHEAKS